jgi:hypothetical protein
MERKRRARITKAIAAMRTVLVDKVDDEDTKERAEARDPICKCDVHGRWVVRFVEWCVRVHGEDHGVDRCPYSKRELGGELVVSEGRRDGGRGAYELRGQLADVDLAEEGERV